MKMIKTLCAIGVVAAGMSAGQAMAKASAADVAKLGSELTPVGAEKAGNADGTIPEWTGGLKDIPAGYQAGKPYIDPFADDKPLFEITKANMGQYADKLSAGQKAMLNQYEGFKIPVYQTRRSVGYKDEIVEIAKNNAANAEMLESGDGLKNFKGVYPFPIPAGPQEVVWNHVMRDRGGALNRTYVQVTPTEGGTFAPVKFYEEYTDRYRLKDFAKNRDDNVAFYFKQVVTAPARLAGNVLLAHETIDQVKEPRRAWIYNAGQRRVRRAPQIGYDGPGTASDGLRTADNFDMYNGAQDRYNWKLEGKVEMYVPYNSYRLDDKSLKYTDIVKAGHLNGDHLRYELHRVWKVVGTLKDGARHIYSKREFYIDEDTWAILHADHYDGRGELWRVGESHHKYYYDIKSDFTSVEALYDLLSGRYIASGLANEIPVKYDFSVKYKSKDFTPAALRRAGKR